jgi:hypothetical protein
MRQTPILRHSVSKKLDLGTKQRQVAGEGILLGEYRMIAIDFAKRVFRMRGARKDGAVAFCMKLIIGLSVLLPPSVQAKEAFAPLPDLTEQSIGLHLQRCSAFYAAFSGVLSETLLDTDDPLEEARLQGLRDRANDNSDGMTTSAVILMTTLEGKSNAEAVNLVIDRRNGYTIRYLRRFIDSGATISSPLADDVWRNDTASCSALVKGIGPLIKKLTGKVVVREN